MPIWCHLDRYISFEILFPTFKVCVDGFCSPCRQGNGFWLVQVCNYFVARFLFYLEFSSSPALYWAISPFDAIYRWWCEKLCCIKIYTYNDDRRLWKSSPFIYKYIKYMRSRWNQKKKNYFMFWIIFVDIWFLFIWAWFWFPATKTVKLVFTRAWIWVCVLFILFQLDFLPSRISRNCLPIKLYPWQYKAISNWSEKWIFKMADTPKPKQAKCSLLSPYLIPFSCIVNTDNEIFIFIRQLPQAIRLRSYRLFCVQQKLEYYCVFNLWCVFESIFYSWTMSSIAKYLRDNV